MSESPRTLAPTVSIEADSRSQVPGEDLMEMRTRPNFVSEILKCISRLSCWSSRSGFKAQEKMIFSMDKSYRALKLNNAMDQVVGSAVSSILMALTSLSAAYTGARIFLHWDGGQSDSNTLLALLKTPDEVTFGNCSAAHVIPVEFNVIMASHTLLEGRDEIGRSVQYLIPTLTTSVQDKITRCLLTHKYECTFGNSNERGHEVPSITISW